jgi:hypothetical protein
MSVFIRGRFFAASSVAGVLLATSVVKDSSTRLTPENKVRFRPAYGGTAAVDWWKACRA